MNILPNLEVPIFALPNQLPCQLRYEVYTHTEIILVLYTQECQYSNLVG